MPRTKPAEERRADLLRAAEELFVAKGVGATAIEEITSRASTSKGLFYLYFRSKEDLLSALQERFVDEFANQVQAAAEAQMGWPAKLDACIEACFDYFRAQDRLHEVLFRHPGHGDLGGRPAAHHRWVESIRSVLAGGVEAGAFQVEDLEATSLLLMAAMHAFDPAFGEYDRASDTQLVRAAQQLARRAVGVRDAG